MLWHKEIDHHPGLLATTLEPLAAAGADLQAVMAYRYPGGADKAALELHPVVGRKSMVAAKTAGLRPHRFLPCWSKGTIARGSATPWRKRSVMRGLI